MTAIQITSGPNGSALRPQSAIKESLQENLQKWKTRAVEDDRIRENIADLRLEETRSSLKTVNKNSDSEFGFADFLDIINPLQHIPVVGTAYREITGDTIRAPSRILGGALFGGFIGAASSVVNAVIEEGSGKDIGGHVVEMARNNAQNPDEIRLAQIQPVERELLFEQPETTQSGAQRAQYAAYTDTYDMKESDKYESSTGFQQQVPHEAVAERMMRALDQYQALLQERHAQQAQHATRPNHGKIPTQE